MINISVVIPTYNRPELLKRAIKSVVQQKNNQLSIEVIVVDDCSTQSIRLDEFDGERIIYKRLLQNGGPQIARNEGIALATGDWVLMLDDDDEFIQNAITNAINIILKFDNKEAFPVFFFATTIGKIPDDYLLITPKQIMDETLRGDFTPIIQREKFIENNLRYLDYPEIVGVGCEQLTWFLISSLFQIPTFSLQIVKVNADAPFRLTSYQNFIYNSHKFALQQDITVQFLQQHKLDTIYPPIIAKKKLGAAIYYLVSGEKEMCKERLFSVKNYRPFATSVIAFLTYLPNSISKFLFRVYKIRFSK
jgi:glycosyltransferase involved in cell wall biosynthesis